MSARKFPVRPDLDQLRHQAKDLLRALRRGDPDAVADVRAHHPGAARTLKLADAQLVLARSYGLPSWPRLVLSCRMTDAIWRDDVAAVRRLVHAHPNLRDENATVPRSNWGPPMSYAANLGKDEIVAALRELGASDVQLAFDRACLQGRLETARRLHAMGAVAQPGSVMGPCETLNPAGLELLLELGAPLSDAAGHRLAPVALLLETYSRGPSGKHACLEIVARHGVELPDTPAMAVHRGRIDLLEAHLRRDPQLLTRTFAHEAIYPPALGCHADPALALHGTPLAGATLLHLAVDGDEMELARWMLAAGADANVRAAVDADGFGGHTPLFGTVVSQPFAANCRKDDAMARLLLDHGADPNVRASLRKQLRFRPDETLHEFRDVTPLAWGHAFHDRMWVSGPVMQLIAERLISSGNHA